MFPWQHDRLKEWFVCLFGCDCDCARCWECARVCEVPSGRNTRSSGEVARRLNNLWAEPVLRAWTKLLSIQQLHPTRCDVQVSSIEFHGLTIDEKLQALSSVTWHHVSPAGVTINPQMTQCLMRLYYSPQSESRPDSAHQLRPPPLRKRCCDMLFTTLMS